MVNNIMRLQNNGDEGHMCYLCNEPNIQMDNLAYILDKEKNCSASHGLYVKSALIIIDGIDL